MKTFQELNVTNSTIITFEGKELRTTQDPYPLDVDFYAAHAVDESSNEYEIVWNVINTDTTDESEVCDWDAPYSVKGLNK